MSDDQPVKNTDPPQNCSCHPSDRIAYGISVCPRKQALSDCRIASMDAEVERLTAELEELRPIRVHTKLQVEITRLTAEVERLKQELETARDDRDLYRGQLANDTFYLSRNVLLMLRRCWIE